MYGLPGTPYAGGIFHMQLNFPPDYPNRPPTVTLLTPLPHPHVIGDRICMNLLGGCRNNSSTRGKKNTGNPRRSRDVVTTPPPPSIDPETGKRSVSILRRSGGDVSVSSSTTTANMVEINGVSYVAVGPHPEKTAATYRAVLEKSH